MVVDIVGCLFKRDGFFFFMFCVLGFFEDVEDGFSLD